MRHVLYQQKLKPRYAVDSRARVPMKAARFTSVLACSLIVLAGMSLTGCSTTHFRESADKETYSVIADKAPEVPGMAMEFTIEHEAAIDLGGLAVNEALVEALGTEGQAEVGASIVSLEKALSVAFTHSREYQNRKEALYLEALSLTLDRHQFTPIFSGRAGAELASTSRDVTSNNALGTFLDGAPGFAASIENLTGTPATLLQSYADVVGAAAAVTGASTTQVDVEEEHSASGNTNVGFDLLLKSGGRLAVNLTTNLLKFLTGDPRESAVSALAATFTQPLLRGAGREVTMEFLTQSERDLLYELRDFTRFRQTFSVRVAAAYYGVLESRNSVMNNYLGLQSFDLSLERERALATEGKSTQTAVGRIEQARLSSEARLIGSIQGYKQQLDAFKILMGLSTDAAIVLDEKELVALGERGIIDHKLNTDEAVDLALVTRLDLYIARDRVDDSERRVKIASNALLPDLDLVVAANVPSGPGNQPLSLSGERAEWSVGLDSDFGLDRKGERNNYRSALITHERSIRDAALAEDEVKLDVRNAFRELEQQKRNFAIQEQALKLNESRVEEQAILTEIGRGNALDLVDARNDLTDAKNQLTSALVQHTITRLEFWRDIGILFIKENGQWEEITDVRQP